jgi:hypothetical protein
MKYTLCTKNNRALTMLIPLLLAASALALPQPAPQLSLVDTRYPNLIIPIYSASPSLSEGTQYSGRVNWTPSSEIATEIVFDNVPANIATTCKLNFYFASTGPWRIAGEIPWGFTLYWIVGGFVGNGDSWGNRPVQGGKIADVLVSSSGDVRVSVGEHGFPCDRKIQVLMRGSRGLDLSWFGEFARFFLQCVFVCGIVLTFFRLNRIGQSKARYCA